MTSRERMLRVLDGKRTDRTPMCFLLNSVIEMQARTRREFLERQLALGIDAVAALPDPAWQAHPEVRSQVRRERRDGNPDLLHKVYHTPAGDLTTSVEMTEDWPHGDDVPLMTDYVIPRAVKRLVTGPQDLAPLGYLLQGPTAAAVEAWRRNAAATKRIADELGVATRGAFNRLGDMICWLCGCETFATMGMTDPAFFRALVALVATHQERLIEVVLEAEPDMIVDPQWYATTFLSPPLFDAFLGPALQRRVDMAHAAGARFVAVATANVMPFFPRLKRLGIDALYGVDPVQGGWDLDRTKAELGSDVTLWGGVNAYLHIVDGSPATAAAATRAAMRRLAPGGRFILAPVDCVRIDGKATPEAVARVEANTRAMVEAWHEYAQILA